MPQRDLYTVAAVFMRPDPLLTAFPDKGTGAVAFFFDGDVEDLGFVNFSPEIEVVAETVIAGSEAEAREMVLRPAREKFSEGEGWICRASCGRYLELKEVLEEMWRQRFADLTAGSESDEGELMM